MDQEKPFKTIEVIDSRTNQVCKVACMSCIRGHRTTSCGIPVCRTKIFWTVKRPGRPSNSCTCRYGATGGCKCVVARSACPHKSKKGEKRSGECRCDEQGRYCCLLEPDHWNALLSLQKPSVDFHPTREALEAKQHVNAAMSLPQTPAFSTIMSPPSIHSIPSTPALQSRMQPLHIAPQAYNGYHQPMSSTLTPRFGMMGIGAPMGEVNSNPPDVLAWEGQAPTAPREFNPQPVFEESEQGSCCQGTTPSAQSVHSPVPGYDPGFSQPHTIDAPVPQHFDAIHETVSLPQISPAPTASASLDKLRNDYFNYQFPSAICQNCGLSGCTCRNCPPVFQNFGTTSWAQCCGRKHARDVQPAAHEPQKAPRTEKFESPQAIRTQQSATTQQPYPAVEDFAQVQAFDVNGNTSFGEGFETLDLPPVAPPDFDNFDIPPDLMLNGHEPLDLNDFLMSDLDRIHENGTPQPPEPDGGGEEGGCCCGG